MVKNETDDEKKAGDVKLRIFTNHGETQTRIALSRKGRLLVRNDSNDTLGVNLDTKDALLLRGEPVERFEVKARELEILTVNPRYPVGGSFGYTATVAGCLVEDPVIIIEE